MSWTHWISSSLSSGISSYSANDPNNDGISLAILAAGYWFAHSVCRTVREGWALRRLHRSWDTRQEQLRRTSRAHFCRRFRTRSYPEALRRAERRLATQNALRACRGLNFSSSETAGGLLERSSLEQSSSEAPA